MSSVYFNHPPTNGKVLLKTSLGDLEIELWPKEAPKTVRNFVQLCMEGYFDNTIFHRLIPKFILQGGDPTGSGNGGESIYGKPFQDEFHSRLRFGHRGLVAMANPNENDMNQSQFFFTLDATPELNGRHTIFGKVVGDTLYNLMKANELEVQKDRPLNPPKLIKAVVLSNPFDDISPRMKVSQAKEEEKPKVTPVKNKVLLSFDDEEDDEQLPVKKVKNAHDVLDSKRLSKQPAFVPGPSSEHEEENVLQKEVDEPNADSQQVVETPLPVEEKSPIEETQAALKPKKPMRKKVSVLEQERLNFLKKAKVIVGNRKREADEDETLRNLSKFQKMLRATETSQPKVIQEEEECSLHSVPGCESCHVAAKHIQDDSNWLGHELRFDKDLKGKDLLARRMDDLDDLVVFDPLKDKKRQERKKKEWDEDKIRPTD